MILCCGEALIDMLPEGGCFRLRPGGAALNTARALGRLGAEAGLLWPLSRDALGAMLEASLAEAGVDLSLCPRVERPTTLAFVTLQAGEAAYAFHDEGSAGRLFAPADLPDLPAAVRALVVGGISLVPDPCGAAVEALVAREASARAVFLDPNIRPAFIADAAAHRARLMRLAARAAVVKLSRDDLDWLWPGRPPAEAAQALLGLGPALVLVTAGAEGATAWRQGGSLTAAAEPVAAADSIGAGDCFNAGILAGLDRQGALDREAIAALGDDALAAVLGLATRVAAASLARPGAGPSWREEVR